MSPPDPVERIALELRVDAQRCLACAGCISVCPRMDIPVSAFNSIAAGVVCRGCGLCVKVCPVEALSQEPILAPPPRRITSDRRDRIIPAYQPPDPP